MKIRRHPAVGIRSKLSSLCKGPWRTGLRRALRNSTFHRRNRALLPVACARIALPAWKESTFGADWFSPCAPCCPGWRANVRDEDDRRNMLPRGDAGSSDRGNWRVAWIFRRISSGDPLPSSESGWRQRGANSEPTKDQPAPAELSCTHARTGCGSSPVGHGQRHQPRGVLRGNTPTVSHGHSARTHDESSARKDHGVRQRLLRTSAYGHGHIFF